MERRKILERGEYALRSSEGLDGFSAAEGVFNIVNWATLAVALGDIVDRSDRRKEDTFVRFSFPSICIVAVVGFGVLTSGFDAVFLR